MGFHLAAIVEYLMTGHGYADGTTPKLGHSRNIILGLELTQIFRDHKKC